MTKEINWMNNTRTHELTTLRIDGEGGGGWGAGTTFQFSVIPEDFRSINNRSYLPSMGLSTNITNFTATTIYMYMNGK